MPIGLEAAILAGGEGRRMGMGKAGLTLAGRPVLDWLADSLGPVCSRVRVIARSREDVPESSLPLELDRRPGLGPLSGIEAALATAEEPLVLVVGCDLPFVTARLARGLKERLLPYFDAVAPVSERGPVAVCALYRIQCLSAVSHCLDRGELAARELLEQLRTRLVEPPELVQLDPEGLCLTNINTREDLERAEAIAKRRL